MQIGQYHELEVGKEVDFGFYLNSEVGEILLPTKYVPEGLQVGDKINVFIYRDSEDRIIATTLTPYAKVDEFAALEVTDTSDHGAFMEWGLEKDLFVPTKEQHVRFTIGRKHVVRVCLDHRTDRLIGTGKLRAFFDWDTSDLEEGQEVDLLIYNHTEKGYTAVVNQRYTGLIYGNEVFESIGIGDQKKGFIKKIREDGKLDLTLNTTGVAAIDDNREVILDLLKKEGGFMPYHDKSDADEITKTFSMSKKAFKKAIGGLYKEKVISIGEDGIKLL
ncbi:GntR family transcriptional regulator [Fulvivirga sp. RKSG066]|uniref:CvfB family protein n=1 Tax=Fulvivirga aurantia TaxID=2529383 RepID=UPI0012BD50D3|nr:S1-like domain-containing RNA-binding protein [Fulvivirga aurantia]MTI22727.1 GntR family transcriptional regulator [Fulvivirga aurantia]